MLPTTYRGDAIIGEERIEGVLHLNSDSIRLALPNNQEILRWPLGSLEVDAVARGSYELSHDGESFMFEPSVDDGLGDEISLRRRFSPHAVEFVTPDPPTPSAGPSPPEAEAPNHPAPQPSLADRVATAGRHSDGKTLLEADADRFRRYLLAGSLTLLVGVLAAIAVTVVTSDDPTVEAAPDPVVTIAPTEPGSPTTAPSPVSTAPPVPSTAPTVSTVPATVAGATVTTAPPTTAPPAAGSVFEIPPAGLAQRWDAAARPLSNSLMAGPVEVGDGQFAFTTGPFVRVQGSVDDAGTVSQIALVGDPSGTVDDDREVLTALGLTLSLVEPELSPEGRRELLAALGLEIEDPDLGGLDGSLEYRGHTYWLRWDAELERVVLDVRPGGGDPEGAGDN